MYFGAPRPVAAFSTICMILLRECRHERSLSLEYVADRLNVATSDWEKAEAAKVAFDFDDFHRACHAMQIAPSAVIFIGERYADIMRQSGWDLLYTKPQKLGRDALLELAQAFWATRLGQGSFRDSPVLVEPNFAAGILTPLFRYALDPGYRAFQDNPPPLNLDFTFAVSENAQDISA